MAKLRSDISHENVHMLHIKMCFRLKVLFSEVKNTIYRNALILEYQAISRIPTKQIGNEIIVRKTQQETLETK